MKWPQNTFLLGYPRNRHICKGKRKEETTMNMKFPISSVKCCLLLLLSSRILVLGSNNYNDGTSQIVEPCEDGIVQVVNITISCDSPYTFYYGSGVNRNSPVCDYGDKATISVGFYVMEDVDDAIYMQMSAYNSADEQLYLGDAVDLCNKVGEACNYEGYYEFSTKIVLASLDSDESKFVPLLEIAFSNEANNGYELGGVNIECDNQNTGSYFDWMNIRTNTTMTKVKTATFAQDYGILIGTCVALAILAFVLVKSTSDKVVYTGDNAAKEHLLDGKEQL
mmetsp:Transcript_14867/g.22872  ORF Transcript_14867/g.22872 Transcript_14867/m.22872 type:complete len:280 (+) Transcript_14867:2-841(+)